MPLLAGRVYPGENQPRRSENGGCHFPTSGIVIGLAGGVLLTTVLGCGSPLPTVKPAGPSPSNRPKDENKQSRPPSPDPG